MTPAPDIERARRLLEELTAELDHGMRVRQMAGEELPHGRWVVQLRYMPLADLVSLKHWTRRMADALNGTG